MTNQVKLPRLPIPSLYKTITKYTESIQPLLRNNGNEFRKAKKRADEFINCADRLQKRLVAYDKTQECSWLEKWWFELAYHSWREGLCIYSNYWVTFKDDEGAYELKIEQNNSTPIDERVCDSNEYGEFQIRRAVRFIQRTLDYKEAICTRSIPVDRTKAGPLCMHQYDCMFGMTRIPRAGCDELCQTPSSVNSRSIIAIADDQIYAVEVYDGAGHRKHDGDLEAELHAIIADVAHRRACSDLDPAVTVLTAGHRDRWSEAYAKLEQISENRATLAAIQNSLFAVSLDTTYSSPVGAINAQQQNLKCHGTRPGHNRWYDKCASYVFDRNGSAGYVGEHSPCDALIPAIMLEEVAKNVAKEHIVQGVRSKHTPDYRPHVHRLRFADVNPEVIALIAEAEEEVARTASNSISRQIRFEGYGSSWIKRAAKVSPDAFVQMALQLTYHRIHGEFAPVYETASTRQFLHGRTETVRSLTSEAADFVDTMESAASSVADKYDALIRASARHQKLLREASAGQGIDRHILGLRMAYLRLDPLPEEPPMSDEEKHAIEEFFNDDILAKSTTFQLSTSGLFPAYYLTHTGFGCVAPERAYGTNYIIESNRIKFGIEGKTRQAGKGTDVQLFENTLRKTLLELKVLCEKVDNNSANL
ncbi:hypothetical protein IW138_006354 [Coemansia sp. RSA 986]|nr:hypothetical protein IW138_006354 [Coemansia sp. RSA 986]